MNDRTCHCNDACRWFLTTWGQDNSYTPKCVFSIRLRIPDVLILSRLCSFVLGPHPCDLRPILGLRCLAPVFSLWLRLPPAGCLGQRSDPSGAAPSQLESLLLMLTVVPHPHPCTLFLFLFAVSSLSCWISTLDLLVWRLPGHSDYFLLLWSISKSQCRQVNSQPADFLWQCLQLLMATCCSPNCLFC